MPKLLKSKQILKKMSFEFNLSGGAQRQWDVTQVLTILDSHPHGNDLDGIASRLGDIGKQERRLLTLMALANDTTFLHFFSEKYGGLARSAEEFLDGVFVYISEKQRIMRVKTDLRVHATTIGLLLSRLLQAI